MQSETWKDSTVYLCGRDSFTWLVVFAHLDMSRKNGVYIHTDSTVVVCADMCTSRMNLGFYGARRREYGKVGEGELTCM